MKEEIAIKDFLKFGKWLESKSGCRREGCEYFNGTTANREEYKCASCKDVWTDEACEVEYKMQNQNLYFCLHCEVWVKNKKKVFDLGRTLMDELDFLKDDI